MGEKPKEPNKPKKLNEPDRRKRRRRQMTMNVNHVIAYGHYIKPPYKVKIRDDTLLFINRVQAYPILPSKVNDYRMRKLAEKYREADKVARPYRMWLRTLIDHAIKIYREIEYKI